MLVVASFFFFSRSFLTLCGVFFLFSTFLRIIIGFFHSGWLAVILFLIFIGGILIILLYLGMFGNYFNLRTVGGVYLFFLFFLIPISLERENFLFSTGDSSLNFYNILFLGLVALLLFFLLKGIRKILGIGRAMRRFF